MLRRRLPALQTGLSSRHPVGVEWLGMNMPSDDNADLHKWLQSLRKDDPLRLQAEFVLTDPNSQIEDSDAMLEVIFTGLSSHGNELAVAAWLVQNGRLTDSFASTLSDKLVTSVEPVLAHMPSNAVSLVGCGRIIICFLLTVYILTIVDDHYHFPDWLLFVSLLSITVGPRGLLTLSNMRISAALSVQVEVLGDLGNPDSIATIAQAYKRGALRETAEVALTKVAANLRPADYGALSFKSVPSLCEALQYADYEFMRVILRALELIGDGRAISAVEELSFNPPFEGIREAAKELLPILRQRDEESRSQSQLLRASEKEQDKEYELLRAIVGTNAGDPAMLVRAAGVEKD